jgi:hypothetical protein
MNINTRKGKSAETLILGSKVIYLEENTDKANYSMVMVWHQDHL